MKTKREIRAELAEKYRIVGQLEEPLVRELKKVEIREVRTLRNLNSGTPEFLKPLKMEVKK